MLDDGRPPRRSSRSRPRRERPAVRYLRLALRFFAILALILIPMGLGAAWVVYDKIARDLPDVAGLATYEAPQTSRILSHDGQVVATMFQENRTMETLDHISPNLVKALLAVEDSRFYQHHGVDWIGVARALGANVFRHEIDQGASTLTMQLARNRFLTNEQSMNRKLKEAILALRIERKYSKDKILEYYLNHVYFGSGAYGASAAASLYFNARSSELTVAQGALIAGLVQAPSTLTPLVNPKGALKRMKLVLQRMRDLGVIDPKKYEAALQEGQHMRFGNGAAAGEGQGSGQLLKYPYFSTYVIAELAKRYPEDMLYRGGLRVATTLDVNLQKICEDELQRSIAELGPGVHASNGAAVLIDNKTGVVRAMVGGTRWNTGNQFNRAWQAVRQPGSSFKPFVYCAALLSGMNEETIVPDRAIQIGNWAPKNSDGKFMGDIPLRTGLQFSRNPVSAQLINSVGPAQVVQLAHAMGVTEPLEANLSLALGSADVSPLSMASAYATIAAGGVHRVPNVVSTVTTPNGQILTDNRLNTSIRVFSAETAAMLTEMMIRVVERGTGREAYLGDIPVAGKTGTTDDSRDAWFVGFTPNYTLAVWIGNDDHTAMYGVYGGGIPAIIWHRIMARVGPGSSDFPIFAGHEYQKVKLCTESTQLAGPGCPHSYTEVFRCGVVPTTICPVHNQEGATPEATGTPLDGDEAPPTDSPPPLDTSTPQPPPEPDAIPSPESTPPLDGAPAATPEASATSQPEDSYQP